MCCESALLKLLGPVALPLDLELSSDMLRALGPINGSLDREKLRLVGGTLYYTKRRLSPERVGLHAVYYIYIVSILYLSYLYRFIYSYNYNHIYIHLYFHFYIHIYMRIYMRIFYIYVLYIYMWFRMFRFVNVWLVETPLATNNIITIQITAITTMIKRGVQELLLPAFPGCLRTRSVIYIYNYIL